MLQFQDEEIIDIGRQWILGWVEDYSVLTYLLYLLRNRELIGAL